MNWYLTQNSHYYVQGLRVDAGALYPLIVLLQTIFCWQHIH